MPYKYLEHQADMGVKAWGESYEEAFQEAGKAMFSLMFDLDKVKASDRIKIEVDAPGQPELLVEWLNELLAQKDINNLVLADFQVEKIVSVDDHCHLVGWARGEKFDESKHKVKTEVKAATYSGLKCGGEDGEIYCQCILDV